MAQTSDELGPIGQGLFELALIGSGAAIISCSAIVKFVIVHTCAPVRAVGCSSIGRFPPFCEAELLALSVVDRRVSSR